LDPFLGEIRLFPWSFAPTNWALCQGQIMSIQQNTALFALLGTQYGGNGQTTFGLPDLRGRTPIHRNSTFFQGDVEGEEVVALSIANIPAHSHAFLGNGQVGDQKLPRNTLLATSKKGDFYYGPDATLQPLSPDSIAAVGGNQPHDNMQPYLTLNYCIALRGVFPARN
jgi:microcystin-dependent protein